MGQAPSRSWRHSSMSILTMDISVAYPYTSYSYQQRKKLPWYFRKTSFLTRKLKNWPWDMQNSVNFDPLNKWNSHGFLKILTYFTWKSFNTCHSTYHIKKIKPVCQRYSTNAWGQKSVRTVRIIHPLLVIFLSKSRNSNSIFCFVDKLSVLNVRR